MNVRHLNRRSARSTMKRNPNAYRPSDRSHVNARGQPKRRFTRRTAARFVEHHPHMKAYRCPTCGAWHVAHRNQETP